MTEQNKNISLTLANDATMDNDGWCLIAPFGELPNRRYVQKPGSGITEEKFLQIVDEDAVDAILANEKTLLRRLKLATVGMPIFKGHPDHHEHDPVVVPTGQPKIRLGVVDKLRKSSRGLEAHCVISRDQATTVANEGFKYPSATWNVIMSGETRNGAFVCSPSRLLSIGLTDKPQISGVDALANARPQLPAATTEEKTKDTMKPQIQGWLAALGTTLANDASESSVLEAITTRFTKLTGELTVLGNAKTDLEATVKTIMAERDGFKTKNTEAGTALANAQTALANEHKSHSAVVIDLAIAQGKIAVAARDTEIATLANATDFPAACAAITARARQFKVGEAPQTDAEKKALANANTKTPRELFIGLVTKKQQDNPKMSYPDAAKAVKSENPGLSDAMKSAQTT